MCIISNILPIFAYSISFSDKENYPIKPFLLKKINLNYTISAAKPGWNVKNYPGGTYVNYTSHQRVQ